MQREVASNVDVDGSVSESASVSTSASSPGLTVTFRLPEPEVRHGWKKKRGTNSAPSIRAPEEFPPRIPTISKLMALAIKLDRGGRESQNNYADIARTGGVTRARITQVMNLLNLAPEIQEEILFLPTRTSGSPCITEKQIRPIAGVLDWERQREMWRGIKKATMPPESL